MNVFDLPFLGLLKGVVWVLEQVRDRAYAQMYDPAVLRAELLQLRISYERGDLSEEEYRARSGEIWDRLRVLADNDSEGESHGLTAD